MMPNALSRPSMPIKLASSWATVMRSLSWMLCKYQIPMKAPRRKANNHDSMLKASTGEA